MRKWKNLNKTIMNTPTKETDAALAMYAHLGTNWLATDVMGAVARLERQRDALAEQLAEAVTLLKEGNAVIESFKQALSEVLRTTTGSMSIMHINRVAMQALARLKEGGV
jgi:Asp-tRNA(Asn)/Glu-tRNA(Gln) amidotransferase B subunit